VVLIKHRPAMSAARVLDARDDVAVALAALPRGTSVALTVGTDVRHVRLADDIPFGHKFTLRALGAGLRVRKYGEPIGRLTCDVGEGAWVHVHNLQTAANRDAQFADARSRAVGPATPVAQAGRARCSVGENPLFDADLQRLYWIDVRDTPAIHARDLPDGREHRWPMAEDIGSIALAGRGRLLAALRSGFAFFFIDDGRLEPIVDPEPDRPRNRLNDGRCDAAGRYWCGSMNPDSGTADGSLYVLDRTLTVRKVRDGYFTPNGMTWSADGRTMFVADTRRGLIQQHDFDAASGALGEPRLFADFGSQPGGPDGATVDAEGGLWWALFDGGCIVRFAPGGHLHKVVRVPVDKPTACAFGGRDGRTLFVTTASRALGPTGLQAQPLAGRVLALDVGVAGVPPTAFMPENSA
jgi:sugar lactone lactonase YvrE